MTEEAPDGATVDVWTTPAPSRGTPWMAGGAAPDRWRVRRPQPAPGCTAAAAAAGSSWRVRLRGTADLGLDPEAIAGAFP